MFRRVLIIPLMMLLVGLVAWGCTDTKDLEDRLSVVEQQQTSISDQLQTMTDANQRAGMVAALNVLDSAGIHELAENAAAGTLEAGASGPVDNAIVAMSSVTWPDELNSDAQALIADLQALSTALDSGDAATVAGPADTAHEAYHPFDDAAKNYLRQAAGLPASSDEDEDTNMGEATATPSGG